MSSQHAWPQCNVLEDQRLYEEVSKLSQYSGQIVEGADLVYVHRRHESNTSAIGRTNLWDGVLPLQLAGGDVPDACKLVTQLLDQHQNETYLEDGSG